MGHATKEILSLFPFLGLGEVGFKTSDLISMALDMSHNASAKILVFVLPSWPGIFKNWIGEITHAGLLHVNFNV